MFSKHRSLLLDGHSPDVLSGLGQRTKPLSASDSQSARSALVENLLFPPFDFQWRVTVSDAGATTVRDNLPKSTILVCQTHDLWGTQLEFESEGAAAAWAYLHLTDRTVLGRPDGRDIVGLNDEANRGLARLRGQVGRLTLPAGVGLSLRFYACGADVLPDREEDETLKEIGALLASIAGMREAFFQFDISVDQDGRCRLGQAHAFGLTYGAPLFRRMIGSLIRQTSQ